VSTASLGAGEVIVLSGTSASGKYTLAEELQSPRTRQFATVRIRPFSGTDSSPLLLMPAAGEAHR